MAKSYKKLEKQHENTNEQSSQQEVQSAVGLENRYVSQDLQI